MREERKKEVKLKHKGVKNKEKNKKILKSIKRSEE